MSEKDENGAQFVLAGALFELLASDKETVVVEARATDQLGRLTFDALPLGTYYLRETAAPEGFELSTALQEVTITGDKAALYVSIENSRTAPSPDKPDRPERPNRPNRPSRPSKPDSPQVVPTDALTPEEVEVLIEDGYVPLSDWPGLTPEKIIEDGVPLVLLPDEEIPLAAMPGLPKTGDGTPLGLLLLLLVGSLTGLTILLRKPKQDQDTK